MYFAPWPASLWFTRCRRLMAAGVLLGVVQGCEPPYSSDEIMARAVLQNSLRNGITSQDAFRADNHRYAATYGELAAAGWQVTAREEARVVHATTDTYTLEVRDTRTRMRCVVSLGRVEPPAKEEGETACSRR